MVRELIEVSDDSSGVLTLMEMQLPHSDKGQGAKAQGLGSNASCYGNC